MHVIFVYHILSIWSLVYKERFFCSAFATENNKSVLRTDTGLLVIICFITEMPLRCNTNGTLTKIRNVDLGFLRRVFLKLILSCSAPWTSSDWGHTGSRENANEVMGQPGWGMMVAVIARSASVGREFSNSDETQGNEHGLTYYKYVEAAAPGEKIVEWGGLEDIALVFSSESPFQWVSPSVAWFSQPEFVR